MSARRPPASPPRGVIHHGHDNGDDDNDNDNDSATIEVPTPTSDDEDISRFLDPEGHGQGRGYTGYEQAAGPDKPASLRRKPEGGGGRKEKGKAANTAATRATMERSTTNRRAPAPEPLGGVAGAAKATRATRATRARPGDTTKGEATARGLRNEDQFGLQSVDEDEEDIILYEHQDTDREGNEDEDEAEIEVRWSQDGGSPRSFRKIKDMRKRERGKRRDKEFLYTPEEERSVVGKFDKYLVSFLAVLYMLSFLDRSNIGNAKIAGLTEDLNLTGNQYEWLLTSFYVTYIGFEWMTLLWKVVPAHKYIAWCVAGWGFIASIQALAWNWWSMVVFRALLGIVEAAFGPGVPFYLSFFYRREELALRTGLFISAAPLATAYAGSLAYIITSIPSPLAPWRLLLIAEGFPSMVMAVVAWYWIPDNPGDARWLNEDEAKIARRRLLRVVDGDGDVGGYEEEGEEEERGVNFRQVVEALRDGKNWITAMMFFSCNVAFSSLPVFLPTIIKDMGYPPTTAQGLSAPPYLLAFLIVILTSFLSDRLLNRGSFILFHSLLGALGYLFLALTPASYPTVKYLSLFPAAAGIFSAIAIVIPWTINNQESSSGKGTGMALLNIIGQCGPLLGTRLYPEGDAPGYRRGMLVCSGAMIWVAILVVVLRWKLGRENRERDGGGDGGGGEYEMLSMGGGEAGREGRRRRRGGFRFIL